MSRRAGQCIAAHTRVAVTLGLSCGLSSNGGDASLSKIATYTLTTAQESSNTHEQQHSATLLATLPCLLSRPRTAFKVPTVCGTPSSSSSSSSRHGAICVARRAFYGGLDDSRVHRLRRSGMTFNRPRGRDTFSVAFESRLRIVPLTQMTDLYGPIDVSLLTAVNTEDPTSSAGNPIEQKKYMSGDAQMRRVVEKKRREEASLREKRDWHVLVVDPIELAAAEAPVPFPSPHPMYYQDWPNAVSPQGRRANQRVLELQETRGYGDPSLPFLSSNLEEGAVDAAATESVPSVATDNAASVEHAYFYHLADRSHLRQNGDTTLLPGALVRQTTLQLPHPDATPTTPRPCTAHTIRQHFHTAVCVDPDIHHSRFHREEAQVEMISAYRNILYEAVELALSAEGPSGGGGGSLRRTSATARAAPYVADVVRVPALCHYSCGRRFAHELGKLNQQSVIKGFHRLSNEAKEALIANRCFTVEIYVPPLLLAQFEKAFLEEAWEPPTSSLNPGRTALYPGLAPPRTLLQYDGWTGKRPELIEAVETRGKSLLSGVRRGLDGAAVQETEVLAGLRVFGAREEQQRMLEGERRTAAAELGTPVQPPYPPLRSGLQADAAGHEEKAEGNKRDEQK